MKPGLLVAPAAAAAMLLPLGGSAAPAAHRVGPTTAWEGVANRTVGGPACNALVFDFGHSPATRFAGGAPGEIGGVIGRSTARRAYYGLKIPEASFDSRLSASGSVMLPTPSGAGAQLGWFHSKDSADFRSSSALTMRFNGNSAGWQMLGDVGSRNALAQGLRPFPKEGLSYARLYRFRFDYDPTGPGKLSLALTDAATGQSFTSSTELTPQVRADGARFDRFGFLNVQREHASAMTIYVDDLSLSQGGGPPRRFDFARDPGWEGSGNRQRLIDCVVTGRQDFGYSPTSHAGGRAGEAGGTMWRGGKAWFADRVGPLDQGQTLYATGLLKLTQRTADADVFLGWFSTASWGRGEGQSEGLERNVVAAQIGGQSRGGFRFTPLYMNSAGERRRAEFDYGLPLLNARGGSRRFWICYRPQAGSARLTVGLGADAEAGIPAASSTIDIPPEAVRQGVRLDRFGLFTGVGTGGASAQLYVDEVRYSAGPGDSGPASNCR